MAYDGLGRRVQIVEYSSGSATSTLNFVWCANQICEDRDGSGNLVRQYFSLGQVNFSGSTGSSYFYSKDQPPRSIREMTNSSGTIIWQQSFDPRGNATTLVSTTPADFGFAGAYVHSRSRLNLAMFRPYSPPLGRWISRDPIGEEGGINLYGYADNDPINFTDSLGLTKDFPQGMWFPGPSGPQSFWLPTASPKAGLLHIEAQHATCKPGKSQFTPQAMKDIFGVIGQAVIGHVVREKPGQRFEVLAVGGYVSTNGTVTYLGTDQSGKPTPYITVGGYVSSEGIPTIVTAHPGLP